MIETLGAMVGVSRLHCDNCGEEMKAESMVLMSLPPQYPHYCECGHRETHKKMYPQLVIREAGSSEWKSLG